MIHVQSANTPLAGEPETQWPGSHQSLEGQDLNDECDSIVSMATQGVWLGAELRYQWMTWYYILFFGLWGTSVYGLSATGNGWGIMLGFSLAFFLLLALAVYYFLFYPLQCEVSFERGHVFYRGKGVRGSRSTRATYVKPLRAAREGLVVSVNSHIRGFRIKFQNDQDAALFTGWCEGAGVPTSQPSN